MILLHMYKCCPHFACQILSSTYITIPCEMFMCQIIKTIQRELFIQKDNIHSKSHILKLTWPTTIINSTSIRHVSIYIYTHME